MARQKKTPPDVKPVPEQDWKGHVLVSFFNDPKQLSAPTIGAYLVQEEIGHGSSGIVVRAQPAKSKKPVALKILHPAYQSDRESLARFEREIRALKAISHNNVVPILDVGNSRGLPFFVMPLLKGIRHSPTT